MNVINQYNKNPAASTHSSADVATRGPQLPCVRLKDLAGAHREIMIEHAGVYYRLRITRANKLILTK